MAKKKLDYYKMTFEELGEHLDKHHQVILENRAWLRENRGKDIEEDLKHEEAIGSAQAHFNVISRIRTAHKVHAEFERSQQMQHLRGQISEETYKSMLQDIGVPFIEGEPVSKGMDIKDTKNVGT